MMFWMLFAGTPKAAPIGETKGYGNRLVTLMASLAKKMAKIDRSDAFAQGWLNSI